MKSVIIIPLSSQEDFSKNVKLLDALSHVILKMITYIIRVAPFGIFRSVAVSKHGFGIFYLYNYNLIDIAIGIIILCVILLLSGCTF